MENNILRSIGDQMIAECEVLISGKFVLNNFVDFTDGTTSPNKDLKREFRYSIDGLFWSDWDILNSYNISKYSINNERFVRFQVRYTKLGGANEIKINSFNFYGNMSSEERDMPILKSSIFSEIWGTEKHRELSQNLFKKLYYRGIIPQYVNRGENRDYREDENFIEFFTAVAKYFALLFLSFEKFENILFDEEMLYEHVRQNSLLLDETVLNHELLRGITSHYLDEVRKRGTIKPFERSKNGGLDGEFLRFISNSSSDEFLINNLSSEKMGWCMGVSSPIYSRTPEKTFNKCSDPNFLRGSELHDFTSVNGGSVSLIDGGGISLRTSNDARSGAGLGKIISVSDVDVDKLYVVDTNLDYLLKFDVTIVSVGVGEPTLNFGLTAFGANKYEMIDGFVEARSGYDLTGDFFSIPLSKTKIGATYSPNGVVFSYSSESNERDKTNMGFGNNLIFNNAFARYISINLSITGGEANVLIRNLEIRPLTFGTNIRPNKRGSENYSSMGFVQSDRLLYCYLRNNNNSVSEEDLTDIANKYLLPYNQNANFCVIK